MPEVAFSTHRWPDQWWPDWSVTVALHGGCHGNGYSWYSTALIILKVNYKILIHDYLCQILFIMLDFCESYAAQCVCPIFWDTVYLVLVGGAVFYAVLNKVRNTNWIYSCTKTCCLQKFRKNLTFWVTPTTYTQTNKRRQKYNPLSICNDNKLLCNLILR